MLTRGIIHRLDWNFPVFYYQINDPEKKYQLLRMKEESKRLKKEFTIATSKLGSFSQARYLEVSYSMHHYCQVFLTFLIYLLIARLEFLILFNFHD